MAKISQKTVELITNTADIVDVISDYVQLQPSGSGFKGLCPFHSEKTPSFSVSKEKGVFKCFGCNEAGNAVTFIQKIKNISYPEALLELAEKYHIPVETEGETYVKNDYSHYYEINEKASSIYQLSLTNLEKGKEALAYVQNRGLDIHTIQYFEIGYAPNEFNSLYTQLKDLYEPVDLIELGLIKKSDKDYFDLFRNRLMFPIRNEFGKTVGFSGREIDGKSDMKYINSPLTKLFVKGNILFNLDKALPFINREKRVVLFEGFFDVIAAFQSGIKEGVCSMGTSLTEEQARLLKKYTDHAIICYDGDNAGFEATAKAIPILQNAGITVSISLLPEGLDPDEFVKKNSKNAFLQFINSRQIDPFEFQYVYLKKQIDLSKPSQVEDFKLKVLKYVLNTDSQMLVELYTKRLAEDIGVSFESIQSDLHHYQLTKAISSRLTERKQKISAMVVTNKRVEAERRLVAYFLYNEDFRQYIIKEVTPFFAKDYLNVQILFYADEFIKNKKDENLKERVIEVLSPKEKEIAQKRLDENGCDYSQEDLYQLINTHKTCLIESQIIELIHMREKIDSSNKEEYLKISNHIIEAKKQINELRKDKIWKKPKS